MAWPLVCRPKDLGGLSISDLRRAGVALRFRWVRKDRQAGSAPRTNDRVVLALFDAATVFQLGDGKSTYFWTDRWIQGCSMKTIAPTFSLPFGHARGGVWLQMVFRVMLGFGTSLDR